MVERSDIITSARSYLGAKWRHQGRTVESGIDCLGIIVNVCHDNGIYPNEDLSGYRREPDGTIRKRLGEYFKPISVNDVGPADIVLFHRWVNFPSHVGIITAIEPRWRMVHSEGEISINKEGQKFRRGVIEVDLIETMLSRRCGYFRIPGID